MVFVSKTMFRFLKKKVRSGRAPLSQVVKRLSEIYVIIPQNKLHTKKICMSCPNNSYMLHDGRYCEVLCKEGENINFDLQQYHCRIFQRTKSLFDMPSDSRLIGVHVANFDYSFIEAISSTAIKSKVFMIQKENKKKIILMTLLHDM